jgi:hypothetical protein
MTYAASSSYSAAYQTVVPVDIYQGVVQDLQESQEMVRALETQNRDLWQQNQQLQQEINRFLGSVNQVKRSADGSVTVASQRVETVAPNPIQMGMPNSFGFAKGDQSGVEADNGDLNIWNIIITVLCIIAVGASVGYSAFRPSK